MLLLKYSYVLIMCMVDCFDCLAENTPLQIIIKLKIVLDVKWSRWQTDYCNNRGALTVLGNHSEGDDIACFFDQLDDVVVGELDDGAPVDRWDAISDVQQAAAVGGTALDDSADFVRNDWKSGDKEKRTIENQTGRRWWKPWDITRKST